MGNTSKQPVQRNTYVERQKEFKQDLSKIKEDGILDEIEKKYLTEKYKLNQYQVKIISQYGLEGLIKQIDDGKIKFENVEKEGIKIYDKDRSWGEFLWQTSEIGFKVSYSLGKYFYDIAVWSIGYQRQVTEFENSITEIHKKVILEKKKDEPFDNIMKNILGEDILKELQKKQEREFTFDDLKTPQGINLLAGLLEKEKGETEAGEILKKIVSEIRETLNTQIQQKAKSIHVNSGDDTFTKLEGDKRVFDVKKITKEFVLFIDKSLLQDRRQKKPESPRKELLNQFIENNINNFNEEEKKVFREIVEGIETQSNYLIVIEHTNKYFESIRNGKSLQDLKIELIEKGVNIYEVLKEQKEQEDENKDKKEGKKQETNDDKLKTALDYSSDITIITRTGQEIKLGLSIAEQTIIQNSPEAKENLLKLHNALEKTGLTRLWNFRSEIFKGIANAKGIAFNASDDDYLNEDEVKIFMNAILKSVGKQEINANIANMSGFVGQVIKQNNGNVFGRAEENRRGNTSIEEEFMRKFHNKRQIFNLVAFEKALKSSSKSDEK